MFPPGKNGRTPFLQMLYPQSVDRLFRVVHQAEGGKTVGVDATLITARNISAASHMTVMGF